MRRGKAQAHSSQLAIVGQLREPVAKNDEHAAEQCKSTTPAKTSACAISERAMAPIVSHLQAHYLARKSAGQRAFNPKPWCSKGPSPNPPKTWRFAPKTTVKIKNEVR